MVIAKKYKMYSGKKKDLNRLCDTAGWVWNHALALSKRYYRMYGKSLSNYRLQSHILKLRKKNGAWMLLNSQTVQDICQRIQKSYSAFFKWARTRSGRRKSPPKFKKSRVYKSITFKQAGFKLNGNKLTINSLGKTFGFHLSRQYSKPKQVTIKRDNCGDFWIIIFCEEQFEKADKFRTGKTAGFDFSLPKFLVSSNGTSIPDSQFFREFEKQVAKANRSLAKKEKGSNNRNKSKLGLAKLHRRIANKRDAYQWELARTLVLSYDVLCFENLNLDAMKRLWGKKVSDRAFYSFLLKVEYLAHKFQKHYHQANQWFPSSKMCSCCGHKKEKLELSQRAFVCENCGSVKDRDDNSSDNLDQLGRALSYGIEVVSPQMRGVLCKWIPTDTPESPVF